MNTFSHFDREQYDIVDSCSFEVISLTVLYLLTWLFLSCPSVSFAQVNENDLFKNMYELSSSLLSKRYPFAHVYENSKC